MPREVLTLGEVWDGWMGNASTLDTTICPESFEEYLDYVTDHVYGGWSLPEGWTREDMADALYTYMSENRAYSAE